MYTTLGLYSDAQINILLNTLKSKVNDKEKLETLSGSGISIRDLYLIAYELGRNYERKNDKDFDGD